MTHPVDDTGDARGAGDDAALLARLATSAAELRRELIEIRRDLHAHPELARTELRTTAVVADRLREAGLSPRLLPGSGLVCDIGPGSTDSGRLRVALRADLDALPLLETSGVPWASTHPGVAHACGHDVHTTAVLGAGLVLAGLAADGLLPTGVRLIFQPAEEVQPGGSLDVIAAGGLDGVSQVYALHCDPKVDVGQVGTRIGPITSASDEVAVTVTSGGGHTSRPHLTGDVVFALGQVITQVPAVLGRRLDPRSGVNLTWGAVQSGTAHNAIPSTGTVRGTLRCLDVRAWERASQVFHDAVEQVVAPYDVEVEVRHHRGVPPVENDEHATGVLEAAARDVLGPGSVLLTEQSLGGEDFAWYLTRVPGALARLGTRTPGGRTFDIHQGNLEIDEQAIELAVLLLARSALLAGAVPSTGTARPSGRSNIPTA
ncbi:amidohydrolase [Cellulomonas sp. P24]|uniref:amidohydrolase n=1 Tax=Cellulomonas sp. P24 TaxID=2885206 RepID=UPI00216AEE2D|nr:amidohydrolase [Cellulomonas sp. P24]MCR6493878.1 amidohydrolase [Cellulomonas sp. P24]